MEFLSFDNQAKWDLIEFQLENGRLAPDPPIMISRQKSPRDDCGCHAGFLFDRELRLLNPSFSTVWKPAFPNRHFVDDGRFGSDGSIAILCLVTATAWMVSTRLDGDEIAVRLTAKNATPMKEQSKLYAETLGTAEGISFPTSPRLWVNLDPFVSPQVSNPPTEHRNAKSVAIEFDRLGF